ncbi:60S ribosomal protein L14-like [Trichogramma pretiosum]|uniref:60S ribosomal protein L14-like n=1 Tax=Trichogramma pretiosum TaxID=7493 RepID=UPI0006C9DB58|nr:60S ribosomal protein L14-like [Trichogramma pretiosum]
MVFRPFKRFVQSGRVAYVSNGPNKGKLVGIVDVIDQNRVLVDGPAAKIPRGQMCLNDLHLTKFRLKILFTGPTRVVRKAWEREKIEKKWQVTVWAKKVAAKEKRAVLSDYDRFKLRKAKRVRNALRTEASYELKKGTKKFKSNKKLAKKQLFRRYEDDSILCNEFDDYPGVYFLCD